jgi:transposase
MKVTYRKREVRLSQKDREQLNSIISKGKHSARTIRRANILLLSDRNHAEGRLSEENVCQALGVARTTVSTVKRQFNEEGLERALARKKRETSPRGQKVTGDIEARILALSCSQPPEGAARWTVKMITDRAIELEIIESISDESVRQMLKKTRSNRT